MNRFKMKIVGLATAVLLSAGALIAPLSASAVTSAVTIDELMAQIVALQAQLLVLQGSSATVSADKCSFSRSLTVGSRGDDVTCLQNYLKGTGHFRSTRPDISVLLAKRQLLPGKRPTELLRPSDTSVQFREPSMTA